MKRSVVLALAAVALCSILDARPCLCHKDRDDTPTPAPTKLTYCKSDGLTCVSTNIALPWPWVYKGSNVPCETVNCAPYPKLLDCTASVSFTIGGVGECRYDYVGGYYFFAAATASGSGIGCSANGEGTFHYELWDYYNGEWYFVDGGDWTVWASVTAYPNGAATANWAWSPPSSYGFFLGYGTVMDGINNDLTCTSYYGVGQGGFCTIIVE